MNALQPTGPTSPVPVVSGTMDIVRAALATGNVDMLREAVALAKELDAIAARKAFDNAMADAKAEIKPVVRNATGHNSKKYADFAAISRAVDPIISGHGLSYRFRTTQTEKLIAVTCILSHRNGHFEESALCGPADATGSKNAIQAIGSTLTYLQRYSLVQALGLAASNDDDGNSSESEAEAYTPPAGAITANQAEAIRKALEMKGVAERAFLNWAKHRRIEDIPSEFFQSCLDKLASVGSTEQ